jgi:hypothetical protein
MLGRLLIVIVAISALLSSTHAATGRVLPNGTAYTIPATTGYHGGFDYCWQLYYDLFNS